MLTNRAICSLAVDACVDSYYHYGVAMMNSLALPVKYRLREKTSEANVYIRDNQGIICFVGTDQPKDWLDNMFVFMGDPGLRLNLYGLRPFKPHAHPLVHEGFYRSYKRLEHDLADIVNEHDHEDFEWLLTGHSLGGAMANGCAVTMDFINHPDLVTFGAPRWGNTHSCWMASQLSRRMFRFRMRMDIVPLLPFPIGRWKHACPEVLLDHRSATDPYNAHVIENYRSAILRYNGESSY